MTGVSVAVQATCRSLTYRQHRTAGRKAEYGRFSVLLRPEIYRNLRIKDSVKIEPACGTGNFLVEILQRKLDVVKREYYPRRGSCHDYELQAMKAVMSIYGVDLLQDNVEACQERLFEIFDKEYSSVCKSDVNFVLSQNILCGNALSMMKVDSQGQDTDDFIVFPEWSFPRNDSGATSTAVPTVEREVAPMAC